MSTCPVQSAEAVRSAEIIIEDENVQIGSVWRGMLMALERCNHLQHGDEKMLRLSRSASRRLWRPEN